MKRSLDTHPFTVMTLFVNPMQVGLAWVVHAKVLSLQQFAPTEDLSRYPRTLQRDLEQLSTLLPPMQSPQADGAEVSKPLGPVLAEQTVAPTDSSPLVVFAPATDEMYPMRGELQDLSNHRGVGVEMRGLGDVMEGASRRAWGSRNVTLRD